MTARPKQQAGRQVSPMSAFPRCSVYELRRYTLCPGTRDAFVALFDAELVESQEDAGMLVLGQFTDLDRPDVFVWIRGFSDMTSRRAALGAFYGGPVWAAHRETANAMMLDSDDVLLLKPAGGAPIETHLRPRATGGDPVPPTSVITVDVRPIPVEEADSALDHSREQLSLARDGGVVLGQLLTERAPNSFPQLPIRDDVHVLVTIARAPGTPGQLHDDQREQLHLVPTSRSALR
jgi:quinol monooxygenase YgiN